MVMVSLVVPGEEVDGLTSLRYMRANSRPSSFPPGKYQVAGAWIWRALKWLTIAPVLLTPWYALSPLQHVFGLEVEQPASQNLRR